MRDNLVKVTTTSGFDGVEIDQYLEPVTAHVVFGMNFFKDFFAGFTDFFGGKSNSYQKVLASMNQEVIDELKRKTLALGGNCILGLKIDNDEISAKDKSMLMVTALGTAAKADFTKKQKDNCDYQVASIDLDTFKNLKQKTDYILAAENKELKLDGEVWEFITTNKTIELAPYVLDGYIEYLKSTSQGEEIIIRFTNRVIEYFSLLEKQQITHLLYDRYLQTTESTPRVKLIHILDNLCLLDFEFTFQLIQSTSFEQQKAALQFLIPNKGNYEAKDLALIEQLIGLIPLYFPERCQRSTKKKMLSAKEKDIWICECGKENEDEDITCKSCNRDPYGFTWYEKRPNDILSKLEVEKDILSSCFKSVISS